MKNTPEIRFKGFTDAWVQRKLGEVAEFKNGMNFTKEAMGHGHPFVNLQNIFGRTVVDISSLGLAESSIQQRNEYILRKGDVLFIRSSVKLEGVGEAAIIPCDLFDTTYSGFIIRCRMNDDFSDNFKQFLFRTKLFRSQMLNSATTSANTNINQDSLNKMIINFPIISEQTFIGNFFHILDSTIALYKRKLDGLKQLKKAYLQQMFPQEGEIVPKIRFAEFTGDWEIRKLEKMAVYKNGKGHEDKQAEDGKYELVNLNSISIDGGLKPSGKFIDETDETLLKNDLVMVLSDVGHGDLLGRVAIIPENNRFVLNQRVALLRANKTTIPVFLFYYINAHQQYFKSQGAGMSQLNISKGCVENFKSYIPVTLDEQIFIGDFFYNLDEQIATQQAKLDDLKKLKSAYLQKMFV